MDVTASQALQSGRQSIRQGAWGDAYSLLSAADRAAPLGITDLELLAVAAYLTGRDRISTELWTRAHNECLRAHDVARAVRCAFWMIMELLTSGETARGSGWLGRAQRLLDDARQEGAERGLLLVVVGLGHLKRGDAAAAYEAFSRAAEIGDRFDHAELKVFGRLGQGQARAMTGHATEAVALFDEIMVAVTVGDVSPIAVGLVYCAVIEACHHIFDLRRIREWTAVLSRWCGSQPDLVPFRGQCLVHRVEILRLSGAWHNAMDEAQRTCQWFSRQARPSEVPGEETDLSLRAFPVGAAFYQLAELLRRRGDFDKAEEAYREASRHGRSPEPGLALLRLAQGRVRAAATAIGRVLEEPRKRLSRAEVLAACVDIMIAARDLATARAAAEELSVTAAAIDAPYLRGLSAQARGHTLLAEGDPREALAALRVAWMAWQEIDVPYEAARARVLMGLACRQIGDEEAAAMEVEAARRVFERLEAAPDLARLDKLPASVGSGAATGLSRRELQVIGLIAAGRTNRVIARELAISERTVDRHVSNILTKLGLPSRSAATAYAYQHGIV